MSSIIFLLLIFIDLNTLTVYNSILSSGIFFSEYGLGATITTFLFFFLKDSNVSKSYSLNPMISCYQGAVHLLQLYQTYLL